MMGWTKELVLEEIIHAFEVDDALPVRTGPRAYGSAMPEMLRETKDRFIAGGKADRDEQAARNERVRRRARISASEISRAEAAFAWVNDHVWDVELRTVLFEYGKTKARKWDWSRALKDRNRRNPTKKAWSKRTTYRWISYACQAISDALDKTGVPLPVGVDLHVAHLEAETSSEPIRCGSGAWLAPGRAA